VWLPLLHPQIPVCLGVGNAVIILILDFNWLQVMMWFLTNLVKNPHGFWFQLDSRMQHSKHTMGMYLVSILWHTGVNFWLFLLHYTGLVTTQSLKRWMRFVLGLLLSWGLEGVLHDLTFCACMKDLLGREKTEAENIQRHKQNKVAKSGSGHVIHVIQCSLWQVGTRVPRSWVELHFLS